MARRPFPIQDVSGWDLMASELDGRNEHPWLREPSTGSAWLYKPTVVHEDRRQGEDWVEKVASEIAQLIRLPAATVDLASPALSRGAR